MRTCCMCVNQQMATREVASPTQKRSKGVKEYGHGIGLPTRVQSRPSLVISHPSIVVAHRVGSARVQQRIQRHPSAYEELVDG